MTRTFGFTRVVIALSLIVSIGKAEPISDSAKTFFDTGVQAYVAGQYNTAADAFEAAYKIAPKPPILFSLAQAERRLFVAEKNPEVLKRAIAHFREYLALVPQGGRRADAIEALSELEVFAVKISADKAAPLKLKTRLLVASPIKGATITLDNGVGTELPFIDEVAPGEHKLVVSANGYFDDTRTITVVDGATLAVDILLKPKPSTLNISAIKGAEVYVDSRLIGTAPVPPVEVPAGEHHIVTLQPGRTVFSINVTTKLGEDRTVVARSSLSAQRKAAYALGVGASVGLLTGTVLALASWNQQNRAVSINDRANVSNISPTDLGSYHSALEARDSLRTGSYIGFAVGAGLGVSAVGMYLFDQPGLKDATSTNRAMIVPVLAPGAAGFYHVGSF